MRRARRSRLNRLVCSSSGMHLTHTFVADTHTFSSWPLYLAHYYLQKRRSKDRHPQQRHLNVGLLTSTRVSNSLAYKIRPWSANLPDSRDQRRRRACLHPKRLVLNRCYLMEPFVPVTLTVPWRHMLYWGMQVCM